MHLGVKALPSRIEFKTSTTSLARQILASNIKELGTILVGT